MATQDKLHQHQNSVEEIDYNDIQLFEIVGKGTYGIVHKAKWRDKFVAVKFLDSKGERKTADEIRQMSRVDHPNIVKLHGVCMKETVGLVMEYAEGGSLYNVLHGTPQVEYNAGHAISWCLQCAKAVAYLHNLKPKPIIHRDLKPLNLLLEDHGRVLKVCDFGTACDLKTYMTNNQGSAAWMAPEVFEGSSYTEKCDIFSWGIILWEVLARRKPFDELGRNPLAVMWCVHLGKRPPLIEDCPPILEKLMIKCWAKATSDRPSMNKIVTIISTIFQFFSGYDIPLEYVGDDQDDPDYENTSKDGSSLDFFSSTMNNSGNRSNSINGTNVPENPILSSPLQIQITDEEAFSSNDVESLPDNALKVQFPKNNMIVTSKFNGSYETSDDDSNDLGYSTKSTDFDDKMYLLLEAPLRPLEPDMSSEESIRIFEEHKEKAREYLRLESEKAYSNQRFKELSEKLSQHESMTSNSDANEAERRALEAEKENLIKFRQMLLQKLNEQSGNNTVPTDWVTLHPEDEGPT